MGYREKHSVETHNNHAKPIKSAVDKFALLPEFLKVRGLVKQHIDSFNYFINNDIKKIMKANDRIVCPQYPSLNLRYTKISIGKPVEYVEHTTEELTPNLCRLSDRTGPREDATRIGSAGVVRRQTVDISPLRRVNQAIYLLTTGAR